MCERVDGKIDKGTEKGKYFSKGQDREVRLHSHTTSRGGKC